MGLVLLIVLLIIVLGGLPTWGYHNMGYGPSGIGGVLLLVVIILLLTGRI
jgi:flagellin-like protein